MLKTLKQKVIASIMAIMLIFGGYSAVENNMGGTAYTRVETETVLNAISATTTSDVVDITGADRVTLSFNVESVTGTGLATSTFGVTVSADGTNFVTYNKLVDNVVDSNSQSLTRVASFAMDSNSTKIYSMDLEHDVIKFMKVTDTITGQLQHRLQ